MPEIAKDHVRNDRRALILSYLIQSGPSSGNDLLHAIQTDFGHRLSPGTMYPCLHTLIDEGVVGRFDKSGKEYVVYIANDERARSEVARAMNSHVTFCGHYADALDSETPEPPGEAEKVEILQDDVSWEPVSSIEQ